MQERRRWATVFLLAALFNYAIGLPIMLARRWPYDLTYLCLRGVAKPLVLAPAFIDGLFVALFIAFRISTARKSAPVVGTS